ncbi:MAG: helix-turn-helix transcriptional regulator [Rhodospirillales bacterium]|nr:helix-turn-helix transcriptional regulator [Acetobacter sp.]
MKKPSPATRKNVVGLRVRQARDRPSLQFSQAQLSECLKSTGIAVCRTMVSKIESGERYVADYELVALARCLNVSTAWLLGETESYGGHRRPRQRT